jgi:hypothetical protein
VAVCKQRPWFAATRRKKCLQINFQRTADPFEDQRSRRYIDLCGLWPCSASIDKGRVGLALWPHFLLEHSQTVMHGPSEHGTVHHEILEAVIFRPIALLGHGSRKEFWRVRELMSNQCFKAPAHHPRHCRVPSPESLRQRNGTGTKP